MPFLGEDKMHKILKTTLSACLILTSVLIWLPVPLLQFVVDKLESAASYLGAAAYAIVDL